MDIKRFCRERPDGFDNIGAITDVGDEMPVHDIQMDQVGTGAIHSFDFLAEAGEVGGQNGGGNQNGLFHIFGPIIAGGRMQAKAGLFPKQIKAFHASYGGGIVRFWGRFSGGKAAI